MEESTVIVSGFEPFGGEKVNPAAETAQALDGTEILPHVGVRAAILPVTWSGALGALIAAVEGRPGAIRAVVMLGQAGGYPAVGLERVAVNVANGKDNAGEERLEQPVVPPEVVSPEADGQCAPVAYFSTLPLVAIQSRLEAEGLPAFISNTAGNYLCNCVFYGFMHYLAIAWSRSGPGRTAGTNPPPAGFIHVPYLPEQAIGKKPLPPSMSRQDIERSIRLALEVAAG